MNLRRVILLSSKILVLLGNPLYLFAIQEMYSLKFLSGKNPCNRSKRKFLPYIYGRKSPKTFINSHCYSQLYSN